jgi:hypothetical protein
MRVSPGAACLSKIDPLFCQLGCEDADACGVASGPCQTCNKTVTDRIADARKNDRDRFSRRYSRPRGWRTDSNNNLDGKRYQFGCRRFQLLYLTRYVAILDNDISSMDIATLTQPIQDHIVRGEQIRHSLLIREIANSRQPPGWLPTRFNRPRRYCAAEKRDEFPPSHLHPIRTTPCAIPKA